MPGTTAFKESLSIRSLRTLFSEQAPAPPSHGRHTTITSELTAQPSVSRGDALSTGRDRGRRAARSVGNLRAEGEARGHTRPSIGHPAGRAASHRPDAGQAKKHRRCQDPVRIVQPPMRIVRDLRSCTYSAMNRLAGASPSGNGSSPSMRGTEAHPPHSRSCKAARRTR